VEFVYQQVSISANKSSKNTLTGFATELTFMNNSVAKIDIKQHRQQFPALENKAYFNFGGQGTLSQNALTAIIDTHRYIQRVGPFSGQVNSWITQQVGAIRQSLATQLQTTPDTITLTENVTAGCNIALWGIEWQKGDRILMTDCEHPGIIATIREIARRFEVEIAICLIVDTLNEGDPVDAIARCLTPNTRLVVLSHLLWNTGQVLPLQAIVNVCHSKQIAVLADAAQSLGSLDLNLPETGVDYYAFTGHKWLCGPAGVGGLYVSKETRANLQPTFIGWRSVNIDRQGNPNSWKDSGEKFEVATSAYPEYAGLKSAIDTHLQWGTSTERYEQICQLSQDLWTKLTQIDRITCLKNTPPEAGLVSFQIAEVNHTKLVASLEERGYFLRTIAYPDCIRACLHYFTLPEEIDRLVTEIELSLDNY
jgi:L-cysteine/cystine lyase